MEQGMEQSDHIYSYGSGFQLFVPRRTNVIVHIEESAICIHGAIYIHKKSLILWKLAPMVHRTFAQCQI